MPLSWFTQYPYSTTYLTLCCMLYYVWLLVSYHSMPWLTSIGYSTTPLLCYGLSDCRSLTIQYLDWLRFICLTTLCYAIVCLLISLISFNACKSAWLPDYTFMSCLDYMLCFILIIFYVHSSLQIQIYSSVIQYIKISGQITIIFVVYFHTNAIKNIRQKINCAFLHRFWNQRYQYYIHYLDTIHLQYRK